MGEKQVALGPTTGVLLVRLDEAHVGPPSTLCHLFQVKPWNYAKSLSRMPRQALKALWRSGCSNFDAFGQQRSLIVFLVKDAKSGQHRSANHGDNLQAMPGKNLLGEDCQSKQAHSCGDQN